MSTPPAPRGLVRRFLREHVRPYLLLQLEIALCLLVGVMLELADPLILEVIVDGALGDADRTLLVSLVALLVGIVVFRIAFRVVSIYLHSYCGLWILFDFRRRAFEKLERLSPYFLRGERRGDVLSRLTADVDVLQRAAAHTIVNAAHDVLLLAGILAVLLWLDPLLTSLVLAMLPVVALLLVRTNRALRAESRNAREAVGGLYGFLEERIGAIGLVQELRRERGEALAHVRVSRPWIRSNLRLSLLGAGQVSIADGMAGAAFAVVFLVGGLRALDGAMTIGELVAYYVLAGRTYRPLAGLIDVNVDLQVARAALARVYELLDLEPDVRERPGARAVELPRGALETRGVGYVWPDGGRVLAGVELSIAPGEVVAIVGPSGGGKSTLAALLTRFLDPSEGAVLLDGLDLRDWKLAELRKRIGLVPQETILFHASLAANLRMAKPRATDEELRAVLADVELAAFVASLPDGLDTLVGEQGLRLSGGERQRLALARALLKDPSVLILDEATSALDARTEATILERLTRPPRRRTIVSVVHRLASARKADRMLVVAGGRLVAEGRHAELMDRVQVYRDLVLAQHSDPPRADAAIEDPGAAGAVRG